MRWSDRLRSGVVATPLLRTELLDHMPAFIDEVIRALYPEAVPLPSSKAHAEEHGEQRLRLGFDVVAGDPTDRERSMGTLRNQYVPPIIGNRTFFVSSRINGGLQP